MRALGLYGKRPKRFRRTTQSDPLHTAAPNILDRRFHSWHQPNQAWVGDITFIWTQDSWVYLAILVDLLSSPTLSRRERTMVCREGTAVESLIGLLVGTEECGDGKQSAEAIGKAITPARA